MRKTRGVLIGVEAQAHPQMRQAETPKRVRFALAEPYTDETWIAYDQNAEEIDLDVVDR